MTLPTSAEYGRGVLKKLFDDAYLRWRGGLKRGGGGRELGDYLALSDIRELWQREFRKDGGA